MNKMDLFQIAGSLNNHPVHVAIDKVTIMAFMNLEECIQHIEKMKEDIAAFEAKKGGVK